MLFSKRTEAKVGFPPRACEQSRYSMVGNQKGLVVSLALTVVHQRKLIARPKPFSSDSRFLSGFGFSGCLGQLLSLL